MRWWQTTVEIRRYSPLCDIHLRVMQLPVVTHILECPMPGARGGQLEIFYGVPGKASTVGVHS